MIYGVTMMRDEADVALHVLEHMLAEGVDHLIVANNLSTDGTGEMLEVFAKRHPVTVVQDDVVGFYQSQKTSHLAEMARQRGAEWVLPFDADEVFYALDRSLTVKQALERTPMDVVKAFGFDHVVQKTDPKNEPNPFLAIGHRRQSHQTFPKVAFRAYKGAYLHMGNHGVERPGTAVDGVLGYRHFGYRSLEHMTRKVRQGKAAFDAAPEIHKTHGTHWKHLGAMSDDDLKAEWDALCAEEGLVLDPAPLRQL